MLGYGVGYPDREVVPLPTTARQYTITNLEPNAQYVIQLRAFNKRGEGFSLYEDVYTRQDTSKFFIFKFFLNIKKRFSLGPVHLSSVW